MGNFDGVERGASFLDDQAAQHFDDQAGNIPEWGTATEQVEPDQAGEWPAPQPFTAKVDREEYPLDALPETLLAAVEEVEAFVQAPMAMAVSSALAALSLAIQAHYDVERAVNLRGPVGLALLAIGDSGERKTTLDGFFTGVIRKYENDQAEIAKPLLKDFRAATAAWEAKYGGIKDKIRQLAKESKSTLSLERDLRDLEDDKPEAPKIPSLLYADVTPEELARCMAKDWPSGGIISSEAGVVLGSHGMGKVSAMRNFSLLNQLWDGAEVKVGRKTSESFTVRGARLTIALQVQEATLREFLKEAGALARGTGFLARFLIAWPESTQGHRPFTEAPPSWPHLAAFNQRIAAILSQPAPLDENGALVPALLTLTPEAKVAWVAFHDAVELELAIGGDLHDVKDVASKTADNAVRLAALFHVFEGGVGAIPLESFEGASRIAAWHLNESRRFFGEMALPVELADAARLDTWLIEHCQRERTHIVGKNHVRQHGPLRDGHRLDAAIRELVELDRARMEKDGRKLTLLVNPSLLGIAS